jgi:hypothetical protein
MSGDIRGSGPPFQYSRALQAPQSLGEQTARNVRKAALEFVEVGHVGEKLANGQYRPAVGKELRRARDRAVLAVGPLPAVHRARDFTKLYLRDTGAKTAAPNLPAPATHRQYRLRPRIGGQYVSTEQGRGITRRRSARRPDRSSSNGGRHAAFSKVVRCVHGTGNDARGITQMMRVGLYRPVHVKTLASQKRRMLLTSRQLFAG